MAGPPRTLMRWTVSTSLRFRYLVVALGALTMAFGIVTLPSNRLDAFPEFAPPRVVVQTACLGLSTSDVEQLVTVPLEQALQRHRRPGRDCAPSRCPSCPRSSCSSSRAPTCCSARQLVQERLATVRRPLPTWAAPPVMLAPVSATGRAMQIGMTSKDHSLIEMSMTAYWTIRARLLRVPGVANVAHLERAAADDDGAGRAGRSWQQQRRQPRPGHGGHRGRGGLRAAQVLHRLGHRHRRLRRDAQPAAQRPQRAADRHPGRPRPGAASTTATATARSALGDVARSWRTTSR